MILVLLVAKHGLAVRAAPDVTHLVEARDIRWEFLGFFDVELRRAYVREGRRIAEAALA